MKEHHEPQQKMNNALFNTATGEPKRGTIPKKKNAKKQGFEIHIENHAKFILCLTCREKHSLEGIEYLDKIGYSKMDAVQKEKEKFSKKHLHGN